MALQQRNQIKSGPSKLDLMLALFDGDSTHRRPVTFELGEENSQLRIKLKMHVNIDGTNRKDGSGESWMFDGYQNTSEGSRKVHGYYSTHTRKGWVEYTE